MDQGLDQSAKVVAQFADVFAASVADGAFVRIVLSPRAGDELVKVLGRCVEIKGRPHLSFTLRYARRDEVRNLAPVEGVAWATERIGSQFTNALLCTTAGDWQISAPAGKRPRLIRHPPSKLAAPVRTHDQPHHSMLGPSASDWLAGLGVTDTAGRVRSGMAAKHSQIARYLEVLSHLMSKAGWKPNGAAALPPRTIVDMGCGKGYLTFGLWHLLARIWHAPTRVIGVDSRQELIAMTSGLADQINAQNLSFVQGDISSISLPRLDGLIALHACDTATDDAIRRGIEQHAELIVVAPCCHKQARPQLSHPRPLGAVLRHGLMEERLAEWLTDGLRALFLEWAGYRTQIIEFVSNEHTAKNLMLAAVRQGRGFQNSSARERIVELKAFFGLSTYPLDPLLDGTGVQT